MELKVLFILTIAAVAQCKLIPLSCSQIREFVDGHNSLRLLLAKGQLSGQPAASEMKSVVWDEELYAKASKWVAKNIYGHNPDKKVESNRFTTGENIYKYSNSNMSYVLKPDKALKAWWKENLEYSYGGKNTGKKVGHYTQMAWSDSVYLGCAISQEKKGGSNSFIVVCNYGPAGNVSGEKPYKSGTKSNKIMCGAKSCSKPYGTKCK